MKSSILVGWLLVLLSCLVHQGYSLRFQQSSNNAQHLTEAPTQSPTSASTSVCPRCLHNFINIHLEWICFVEQALITRIKNVKKRKLDIVYDVLSGKKKRTRVSYTIDKSCECHLLSPNDNVFLIMQEVDQLSSNNTSTINLNNDVFMIYLNKRDIRYTKKLRYECENHHLI